MLPHANLMSVAGLWIRSVSLPLSIRRSVLLAVPTGTIHCTSQSSAGLASKLGEGGTIEGTVASCHAALQ